MARGERHDFEQDYRQHRSGEEPRIYTRGRGYENGGGDERHDGEVPAYDRRQQGHGLRTGGATHATGADFRTYRQPSESAERQSHAVRHGAGEGQSGVAPLLGAAALGFVAGMAANFGRKAVIEATTAVQGDWFDALKAEHRLVDQAFLQILETDDTQTMKRAALLAKLTALLAKHDLEESSVIYPALRMHGRDGEGRHLAADHADIKAYLHELDEMPKDDPNWIQRIRAFQELVQEHVREEEEQIYPAFREVLTKEQNTSLTLKLHRQGLKLA